MSVRTISPVCEICGTAAKASSYRLCADCHRLRKFLDAQTRLETAHEPARRYHLASYGKRGEAYQQLRSEMRLAHALRTYVEGCAFDSLYGMTLRVRALNPSGFKRAFLRKQRGFTEWSRVDPTRDDNRGLEERQDDYLGPVGFLGLMTTPQHGTDEEPQEDTGFYNGPPRTSKRTLDAAWREWARQLRTTVAALEQQLPDPEPASEYNRGVMDDDAETYLALSSEDIPSSRFPSPDVCLERLSDPMRTYDAQHERP